MPQPQEYTVSTWSAWQDRDNDGEAVRDIHGNFKGSVTFEEDKSEPIDATFKIQPNPGDKKYGTVDLYQTRAGKTRKGFKSAPRPQMGYGDNSANTGIPGKSQSTGYTRDDDAIRAQWAIGQATGVYNATMAARKADNDADITQGIEKLATKFYAMVDRVKGSKAQTASGYDKARQQAQQIRERLPEPSTMPFEGEQYPIDDVPPEYR